MSLDKAIKKHQKKLEVMREEVRNRKEEFLSKIDIDEMMVNPKEYLTKLSTDFYNSNEDKIKKSIQNGKKLAKVMVKGVKND
jgi:molecular chaperone DnaK (HSP70)